MKTNKPVKEEKHDTTMVKIASSVVLILISFLAEIYVMINAADNLTYLLIFAVLLVLFSTFLVITLIQTEYQKKLRDEEQYDNIFKSEKASYLLIRSNFDRINERLDAIEESAKVPAEEIINAQKAFAKVSISRSKENADAVLNSNDQILNKLFELDDQVKDELLMKEQVLLDKSSKEILAKSQEILSELKNVELSVRNEILNLKSVSMAAMPGQQAVTYSNGPVTVNETVSEEPEMTAEEVIAEAATEIPEMAAEEVIAEAATEIPEMAAEEVITEAAAEEPEMAAEEAIAEEPEMAAEEAIAEAAAEEPEMTAGEAVTEMSEAPVVAPEEPTMEDAFTGSLKNDDNILAALDALDEIVPREEAVSEPAPVMPDVSDDPNHVMTPDEIAALLEAASSSGGGTSETEPEPEPITPAEPETPPMPDLSDPNHIMTPDEIAALLANS